MDKQAFIIQQVGTKDSHERRRADEIYDFVIVPAVRDAGLNPYRADLAVTPGAITPKMLSELLNARIVIADLTGRNPNVFYELGIMHSFARPLISIADSSRSLPFDAKDERIIELGEYPPEGLGYVQGQKASSYLRESLRIVLAANYKPPSPLRDVAANRSVEDDISALRNAIVRNLGSLDSVDFDLLIKESRSSEQVNWAKDLHKAWESRQPTNGSDLDPWEASDPWATDYAGGYSDEPPF